MIKSNIETSRRGFISPDCEVVFLNVEECLLGASTYYKGDTVDDYNPVDDSGNWQ